jgi:hypothetical protein
LMLVLSAVEWIASDFVIRISYFSMLDNSLPNMKIRPTTIYLLPITSYHLAFGISTLVESALQINHFLTNKANFQKSQMNVNKALTKDYGKMDTWSNGKNKAKTKPKQSQFKANSKPIQTQFKANTNPIQTQFKANTNPIQSQYKPNSNPIQTQFKPNSGGKKCCLV